MKKFTLLSLLILICCCFTITAQNYVSTDPSNKNVLLEEFTGVNCQYCPLGHLYANQYADANPGRFWAINIHTGGYASTSYPNFNTSDGATIASGFSIGGYPAGTLNRNGTATITPSTNAWWNNATTMLNQPAVANIAGVCIIDPATRIATINIEVYYTANGAGSSNKVTVAMLQNNILGSQSGMSYNPGQVINGQYNHMHALRDIITNTWGDEITDISQGSLVELTYTYEIPDIIGSPNGIEVIVDDLEFLAWVAETNYQIITVNELEIIIGSDKPINPAIKELTQQEGISCEDTEMIEIEILNGGVDEITSIEFEIDVDGFVTTQTWEGSIPSYLKGLVEMEIGVNTGEQVLTITIIKVNGTTIEQNGATTKTINITHGEWSAIEDPMEYITLKLWQDKFGHQITWKVFASDMTVIASGGPYGILPNTTPVLREHVISIENDDCIKFIVYDSGCNGFNNTQGAGHYELIHSNGNIIFESDATFECEESATFNVKRKPDGITDNNKTTIYPNPANDYINITDISNVKSINIYNVAGKLVLQSTATNEVNISTLNKGVYFLKLMNNDNTQTNIKFVKE
ncbi:MAG: Omp28-related outer membrane protein [Bacteroidales bacterium]|nr:Omp28-related outer membrane protein [Bacteroidales bacterium]